MPSGGERAAAHPSLRGACPVTSAGACSAVCRGNACADGGRGCVVSIWNGLGLDKPQRSLALAPLLVACGPQRLPRKVIMLAPALGLEKKKAGPRQGPHLPLIKWSRKRSAQTDGPGALCRALPDRAQKLEGELAHGWTFDLRRGAEGGVGVGLLHSAAVTCSIFQDPFSARLLVGPTKHQVPLEYKCSAK